MRSLFISILFALVLHAVGVAQSREDKINRLIQMGMEDIRIVEADTMCYVSFEDNIYRSPANGISEVIRALRSVDSLSNYQLVLVDEGVPQINISVPRGEWVSEVSYNTDDVTRVLRDEKAQNRTAGRVDLVLYPELYLANNWYDKLYGVAVNISPAVEMRLWRGARGYRSCSGCNTSLYQYDR